jgi:hypothetical protein
VVIDVSGPWFRSEAPDVTGMPWMATFTARWWRPFFSRVRMSGEQRGCVFRLVHGFSSWWWVGRCGAGCRSRRTVGVIRLRGASGGPCGPDCLMICNFLSVVVRHGDVSAVGIGFVLFSLLWSGF